MKNNKELKINPGHNILQIGENKMELIDFRIVKKVPDGETKTGIYGINVSKVIEIIRVPKQDSVYSMPDSPEFVKGMFNLRGNVIPLVDLPGWMRAENHDIAEKDMKVIIAEFNKIKVGFIVHDTKRIRRVSWQDIQQAAVVMANDASSKITGIIKIRDNDENDGDEEKLLSLLDFEAIVEEMGFYHKIETQPTDESAARSDKTILVIDDSNAAKGILKQILHKHGYDKIIEADNGKNGLDILEKGAVPDLILCDVEMPVMDGYTFTKTVKENPKYKNIPVIINTSLSGYGNKDKAIQAGADSYIVKFNADEIMNMINQIAQKS